MKPSEASVYSKMRSRILGPIDRIERVENGLLVGMPDVNYCIEGQEGWIEIKAPVEPTRKATPLFGSNHQVSIEQINWMHVQHMAGGVSWLLISTQARMLLIHGGRVAALERRINTLCVAELEKISHWQAPVPTRDIIFWGALRELLSRNVV